jgi:hypothetical protein
MVLTAAQTISFFENAQMGIPHATVVQLANEGIDMVDEVTDFDKNSLQQVATIYVIQEVEFQIQIHQQQLVRRFQHQLLCLVPSHTIVYLSLATW